MKAIGVLALLLLISWGVKNWGDSKPPIQTTELDKYLQKVRKSRGKELRGLNLSGREKHLADTASLIDLDQEHLN